jgi:hypothetical protein
MEYWFWELAHLYVHVTELAQASVFEPTLFTSHNSTEKQTQFSIFWNVLDANMLKGKNRKLGKIVKFSM